jgi:hypothetical protein
MEPTTLWELFQRFGPWAVVALLGWLFLRVLLDEDRTALLRARVHKLAFAISGRRDQEKLYISNDVKGRLNTARRVMHFGTDILPRAIDVPWAETGEGGSADVKEGEFVVKLDPSASQPHNISLLALAVVRRTTLTGIRHSVEPGLKAAIDYNLARELLKSVGNKAALDWFLSQHYQPIMAADNAARSRNEQIVTIDERGLFTRLLLVEMEAFAREVHGKPPRPYMAGEIEGLVDFLYKICSREVGQEVPLSYERAFIRIGVIIVAKTAKLLRGLDPYITAMNIHLEHRVNSIYVMVFDKEWLGEVDPRAYDQWERQFRDLKQVMETATPARKHFDVTYTCLDKEGNRRRARFMRFIAPTPGDAPTPWRGGCRSRPQPGRLTTR